MTETSPRHHRDITETRPRQHQNNTETSPKKDRDKTETRPRHHRDITKTTPRHDRDITETRPRQHQNNTETSPKNDRDKTETRPRHDRDITETSPRQDRDILSDFFSGACAEPGRLIHVRPQAYRYWGKISTKKRQKKSLPKNLCRDIRTKNLRRVVLSTKQTLKNSFFQRIPEEKVFTQKKLKRNLPKKSLQRNPCQKSQTSNWVTLGRANFEEKFLPNNLSG